MSKFCQVTGKKSRIGYHRSHAMNANKRRFKPNLHFHRFWVEKERRFITLRVSSKGMRIIDKNGMEKIFSTIRTKGK